MTIYRQLTLEDRVLISHLRWQGLSYAEVASQMGDIEVLYIGSSSAIVAIEQMVLIGPRRPTAVPEDGGVDHGVIDTMTSTISSSSGSIFGRNGALSRLQVF